MEVSNKEQINSTNNAHKKCAGGKHHHHHEEVEEDEAVENAITLPKEVMRRVNALKNIQLKMVDVETKFYEELHLLECKYAKIYDGFYQQREKIVTGEYEPNEEEAKFVLDEEPENKDGKDEKKTEEEKKAEEDPAKGIPQFWLHAMKSTDILGSAIQEHDEPILDHLRDIRVVMKNEKPYGYTIEFQFAPNEYFTNTVLTKNLRAHDRQGRARPVRLRRPGSLQVHRMQDRLGQGQGRDHTTRSQEAEA